MRKLALAFVVCVSVCSSAIAADKLKLLIVDGQNNHQWQKTTPILKAFLEDTNRFTVDVATSPGKGSQPDAWKSFRPEFAKYDVVLMLIEPDYVD